MNRLQVRLLAILALYFGLLVFAYMAGRELSFPCRNGAVFRGEPVSQIVAPVSEYDAYMVGEGVLLARTRVLRVCGDTAWIYELSDAYYRFDLGGHRVTRFGTVRRILP